MDGGKSNLNFAEAALLIQGSTAVYSRKVEHLHQLVLQSIEYINNKKNHSNNKAVNNPGDKNNKSGNNRSENIFDDESLLFGNDADPTYLLLDDIIEAGKNINLNTNLLNNSRSSKQLNISISDSRSGGDATTTSKANLSLMQSIMNDEHSCNNLKLSSSVMDSNGALLIGNNSYLIPFFVSFYTN